jgi:hypothetical protein
MTSEMKGSAADTADQQQRGDCGIARGKPQQADRQGRHNRPEDHQYPGIAPVGPVAEDRLHRSRPAVERHQPSGDGVGHGVLFHQKWHERGDERGVEVVNEVGACDGGDRLRVETLGRRWRRTRITGGSVL